MRPGIPTSGEWTVRHELEVQPEYPWDFLDGLVLRGERQRMVMLRLDSLAQPYQGQGSEEAWLEEVSATLAQGIDACQRLDCLDHEGLRVVYGGDEWVNRLDGRISKRRNDPDLKRHGEGLAQLLLARGALDETGRASVGEWDWAALTVILVHAAAATSAVEQAKAAEQLGLIARLSPPPFLRSQLDQHFDVVELRDRTLRVERLNRDMPPVISYQTALGQTLAGLAGLQTFRPGSVDPRALDWRRIERMLGHVWADDDRISFITLLADARTIVGGASPDCLTPPAISAPSRRKVFV